ncbi:MAG: helix-hairpin-helix domain-containing protein [Desulfitobacteriia bacterium]
MERKLKILWWGIFGILFAAAAVKFMLPVKSTATIEELQGSREIVVYVTGAVQKPGLYRLPLDSRLDDVLKEARLKAEADRDNLNPAQKLKDGQKIVIPYRETDLESDTGSNLSGTPAKKNSEGSTSRVNINKAGLEELSSLPGIGPVLAQRIIDYREENGFFTSVEDIQNVSGIGPKKYEMLVEKITIGP